MDSWLDYLLTSMRQIIQLSDASRTFDAANAVAPLLRARKPNFQTSRLPRQIIDLGSIRLCPLPRCFEQLDVLVLNRRRKRSTLLQVGKIPGFHRLVTELL